MTTNSKTGPIVSAVIPAYEEAATIGAVIRVVENHPLIREVIVVDDGSRDGTAARARETSARVIVLRRNGGKASAMEAGVAAAAGDIILFLDADLRGLTAEMVSAVVEPVMRGAAGMFVGVRDRKIMFWNRLLRFTPILGGERALQRRLWDHVPFGCKKNFQIEIALNYYAKRLGIPMAFALLPGLKQVVKEQKRGLVRGFYQRLLMIWDVCYVTFRLYVVENVRLAFRRRQELRPLTGSRAGNELRMKSGIRHPADEVRNTKT